MLPRDRSREEREDPGNKVVAAATGDVTFDPAPRATGDKVDAFLKTVPPFASEHMFCASQDGIRNSDFSRTVPTKTDTFFRGL